MSRVDPTAFLARRGAPAAQHPPADLSPETLGVLAIELAPLQPLAAAQCVAEAVGALLADVQAGQSAGTLLRLRQWVARWQRVRPDLRAFYEDADVHTSRAGEWGLRRLLDGHGTAPGPLRGELDRLWIDRHGCKAPFTLIPTVDL